jgi:hypothetical protein
MQNYMKLRSAVKHSAVSLTIVTRVSFAFTPFQSTITEWYIEADG